LKSVLMFLHTIVYLDVSEPPDYQVLMEQQPGFLNKDYHGNHYRPQQEALDWHIPALSQTLPVPARIGTNRRNLTGAGWVCCFADKSANAENSAGSSMLGVNISESYAWSSHCISSCRALPRNHKRRAGIPQRQEGVWRRN
jgi:hypothetical protein